MKVNVIYYVLVLSIFQHLARAENSVEPSGAPPGSILVYRKEGKNDLLELKDRGGNVSPVWQSEVGEPPAVNKRSDENMPYPNMSLVQGSLNDGILAALFEFNLPSDDGWYKHASHKPKFLRIFKKEADEKWRLLVSLMPASLWWDARLEDISGILVVSPHEFEVSFKRGWRLRAGFQIEGQDPNEISVFEIAPATISASNDNKIYKDILNEPMRRKFCYNRDKAFLYLVDPDENKVVFRNSIWWPLHDKIEDFPRGRYHWSEELKRQEKVRKENQITELYDLHLPPAHSHKK